MQCNNILNQKTSKIQLKIWIVKLRYFYKFSKILENENFRENLTEHCFLCVKIHILIKKNEFYSNNIELMGIVKFWNFYKFSKIFENENFRKNLTEHYFQCVQNHIKSINDFLCHIKIEIQPVENFGGKREIFEVPKSPKNAKFLDSIEPSLVAMYCDLALHSLEQVTTDSQAI